MIITKTQAIMSLRPDSEWVIQGDELQWLDTETTAPTDDEINTEIARLQILQNRKEEYPSIGDQLDMQYWDAVNGTTTWKDAIAQVKADNPKPQE